MTARVGNAGRRWVLSRLRSLHELGDELSQASAIGASHLGELDSAGQLAGVFIHAEVSDDRLRRQVQVTRNLEFAAFDDFVLAQPRIGLNVEYDATATQRRCRPDSRSTPAPARCSVMRARSFDAVCGKRKRGARRRCWYRISVGSSSTKHGTPRSTAISSTRNSSTCAYVPSTRPARLNGSPSRIRLMPERGLMSSSRNCVRRHFEHARREFGVGSEETDLHGGVLVAQRSEHAFDFTGVAQISTRDEAGRYLCLHHDAELAIAVAREQTRWIASRKALRTVMVDR